MVPQVVTASILTLISLIVFVMSYLLGVCRQFSLVAGLDVTKVRDGDGLARLFRTWLPALGAAELLIAGLSLLLPDVGLAAAIAAFAALHLACVIVLMTRAQRFLG